MFRDWGSTARSLTNSSSPFDEGANLPLRTNVSLQTSSLESDSPSLSINLNNALDYWVGRHLLARPGWEASPTRTVPLKINGTAPESRWTNILHTHDNGLWRNVAGGGRTVNEGLHHANFFAHASYDLRLDPDHHATNFQTRVVRGATIPLGVNFAHWTNRLPSTRVGAANWLPYDATDPTLRIRFVRKARCCLSSSISHIGCDVCKNLRTRFRARSTRASVDFNLSSTGATRAWARAFFNSTANWR